MSFISRSEAFRLLHQQRYVVYALVDPRDDLPHYIGRAVNPERRLKAHVYGGGGHGKARRAWLAELRALGLAPSLKILDVARGVAATVSAEQRWVDFGRKLGWPLTNRVGGARGGVWSLGRKRDGGHWQPRDFERELSAAALS